MDPTALIFIVLAILAVIGIRVLLGSIDKSRINDYLRGQGATMTTCRWSPFSTGWFGSKNERIYAITYTDSEGKDHEAVCKTSMLSGVYFTEDSVVGSSLRSPFPEQDEVTRLRNENAELKRRLGE